MAFSKNLFLIILTRWTRLQNIPFLPMSGDSSCNWRSLDDPVDWPLVFLCDSLKQKLMHCPVSRNFHTKYSPIPYNQQYTTYKNDITVCVPWGNKWFEHKGILFHWYVGGGHGDTANKGAELRARLVLLTGLTQGLVLDRDRGRQGVQEVKVLHRNLRNTTHLT